MLKLISGTEEKKNRVWLNEIGMKEKEDHAIEDNIKKLLYSSSFDDAKLAITMIEKRKDDLDLIYIFDMVRIEPGKFYQGENKVLTEIKEPYYISKFMLTQGIWQAIMGDNPSSYKDGDARQPVDNFTLEQMNELFEKLSAFGPFRLPKDFEWEYAADGAQNMPLDEDGVGIADVYAGFSDINEIEKYAWIAENSDGHPHRVGELLPNKMGIYDMSGNMYELIAD